MAKNGPKWRKILSVAIHISGTTHHMMVIYGTYVENDNISRHFFHFLKILIYSVVSRVKGQKMAQNDKNILSFTLHIAGSIHHVIVIFGTRENDGISRCFFHFFNILILWVVSGVKGQKVTPKDKKFCPSHCAS